MKIENNKYLKMTGLSKVLNLLVLMLVFTQIGFAQWEKLHDLGDGQSHYFDMIPSSNSHVGVSGFGQNDITISRVDLNGDTIWVKDYNYSASSVVLGWYEGPRIHEDPTNGDLIVLTLVQQGQTFDGLILRTDQNGNLISMNTLGLSLSSVWSNNVRISHSVLTQSGDIAFTCNRINSSGTYDEVAFIKTDISGNVLVNKSYGFPGYSVLSQYVSQSQSGNYLLSAKVVTSNLWQTHFNWVLELDGNGDSTLTHKIYNQAGVGYSTLSAIEINSDVVVNVISASNGGPGNFSRMLKIQSGNTVLDSIVTINSSNGSHNAISNVKTSSYNSIIVSTGQYGGIIELDSHGGLLYEYNDQLIGNPDTVFHPFTCYETNGGFVVAGHCTIYTATSSTLIPFVRLQDSLNTSSSPCSSFAFQNNGTAGSHWVYTCDSVGIDLSQGLSIVGGTAPFTYQWYHAQGPSIVINNDTAFNATVDTVPDPSQDWFLLYVTDANGCSIYDTVYVVQDTGCGSLNCTIKIDSITQTTANDALVHVSGNQGFPTYIWSDGSILTQPYHGPFPVSGTYCVTVLDTASCSDTACINVNVSPCSGFAFQNNGTAGSHYIYTCDTAGIDLSQGLSIVGGTAPFTYQWYHAQGPAIVINNPNALNATIDTVPDPSQDWFLLYVTDSNGCSIYDTVYVAQDTNCCNLTVTITHDTVNNTLTAMPFGGNPPYSYQWSNGQNTAVVLPLGQGTYCVTVIDVDSCHYSTCINLSDTIWPGDCDANGVADIVDILPIGIGYGSTGPVRPNATINWVGQFGNDWGTNFVNGVDYKHADCNGDGLIDQNDLSAILLNYGLTHAKGETPQFNALDPSLIVDITLDTAGINSLMTAVIKLGDAGV
ncbi:MAG: hypothetical protein MRY83_22325, partial [Flavobacteriales bacterium]|nr:hypothetical protein [Flavobacteriales bacterium]